MNGWNIFYSKEHIGMGWFIDEKREGNYIRVNKKDWKTTGDEGWYQNHFKDGP